ncbi:hypothetical protein C8J56DRAFT_1051161 [Mycena floridula]|nr:hypothetical protein C8J56DRAFT_1051161 [Mycena floridula]
MSSILITLLVFFCHCRLATALTLTISGSSTLAVGDTLVCTWTATSTDPATFLLGASPSPTGPNADTAILSALGGPIEIDRDGETTGTETIAVLNTAGSYILGAAPATGAPVTLKTLLTVVPFLVIPKLASDGAKAPTVASSSSSTGTISQPTSSTNNEKTNARNYGLIFGGSIGTLVLLGAT